MNTSDYDQIFRRARRGRSDYVNVHMDDAEIVVLAEGQPGAIATRELGGCSVVAILGRTAAIMAHIGPLPSREEHVAVSRQPDSQTPSRSEQHFVEILRQVETLFINYRRHFPPQSTAWGIYVAHEPTFTYDLEVVAAQRLSALGLPTRHTYYQASRPRTHPDEVRVAVQIDGSGHTSLYVERERIDHITFPAPLPDRHASQRSRRDQTSYLQVTAEYPRFIHMLMGSPLIPDFARLQGVYEVWSVGPSGRGAWVAFDFTEQRWV